MPQSRQDTLSELDVTFDSIVRHVARQPVLAKGVTVHGQERGTDPFSRVIDKFRVLLVSGSHRISAVKMRQSPARERLHLHRTDYPDDIANGWEIGSGEIESACRTVVGQRLKGAGMPWRPPGTTAICQLRALFECDPTLWNSHWRPTAKLKSFREEKGSDLGGKRQQGDTDRFFAGMADL